MKSRYLPLCAATAVLAFATVMHANEEVVGFEDAPDAGGYIDDSTGHPFYDGLYWQNVATEQASWYFNGGAGVVDGSWAGVVTDFANIVTTPGDIFSFTSGYFKSFNKDGQTVEFTGYDVDGVEIDSQDVTLDYDAASFVIFNWTDINRVNIEVDSATGTERVFPDAGDSYMWMDDVTVNPGGAVPGGAAPDGASTFGLLGLAMSALVSVGAYRPARRQRTVGPRP